MFSREYLKAEGIFCSDEEDMFWRHGDMEWKDAHRQAVLDKRELFKVLWDRLHLGDDCE